MTMMIRIFEQQQQQKELKWKPQRFHMNEFFCSKKKQQQRLKFFKTNECVDVLPNQNFFFNFFGHDVWSCWTTTTTTNVKLKRFYTFETKKKF